MPLLASGTVGWEDCAGTQTGCERNGCPGCSGYVWWCSYPHYLGCRGSGPQCLLNTNLTPINGYCTEVSLIFSHRCSPFNTISGVVLDECGPPSAPKFAPLCQVTAPVVACLNPSAFTNLCGCNYLQVGVLEADVFI